MTTALWFHPPPSRIIKIVVIFTRYGKYRSEKLVVKKDNREGIKSDGDVDTKETMRAVGSSSFFRPDDPDTQTVDLHTPTQQGGTRRIWIAALCCGSVQLVARSRHPQPLMKLELLSGKFHIAPSRTYVCVSKHRNNYPWWFFCFFFSLFTLADDYTVGDGLFLIY